MIGAFGRFGREPVLVMGDMLERILPSAAPLKTHPLQRPMTQSEVSFPKLVSVVLEDRDFEEEVDALGCIVVLGF